VYSLGDGWLMHDDQEAGTARFGIGEKKGDEEMLNKAVQKVSRARRINKEVKLTCSAILMKNKIRRQGVVSSR